MSNKNEDELEYQFPSDNEYTDNHKVEASEDQGEKSQGDSLADRLGGRVSNSSFFSSESVLKNKKIWLALLIITIVLIYFNFFTKSNVLEQINSVQPVLHAPPVKQNVVKVAPASLNSGVLPNQVKSLQYSVQENAQNNSKLSEKLGSISNALSAVQENQKKIVEIAAALNKKFYVHDADKKEVTYKKSVQGQGKIKQAIPVRGVRYALHAIIPGRAWLEGSDGLLLTVAVGDQLPGYGKILSIDTDQDNVITSSGINISY